MGGRELLQLTFFVKTVTPSIADCKILNVEVGIKLILTLF